MHQVYKIGVCKVDNYITAEETAQKWDISLRKVQEYCKAGRVEGAIKFGNTWAIPKDAKKPTRTGKLKPGRKPKTSEGEPHGQT